MEKIISVKNLRKAYKKSNRFDSETAVQNVCFELAPGNIMGLLGTNGAGKTTTLKMITNLCSKDNGKIVIDNVSLDENPGLALSKVGAALDTPSFYQELTARENIECFAHLYDNIPNGQVLELLDYVGLGSQAEKKVKKFSLGMKQRLALARAMLGQPKLIILDEPANGLDPQGQINLYRLICEMAEERNTTFIVSSHQLHDMEKFCTDILIWIRAKVSCRENGKTFYPKQQISWTAYWKKQTLHGGSSPSVKESVWFHRKEISLQSDLKISVLMNL